MGIYIIVHPGANIKVYLQLPSPGNRTTAVGDFHIMIKWLNKQLADQKMLTEQASSSQQRLHPYTPFHEIIARGTSKIEDTAVIEMYGDI
ncbi:hypothetical protein LAZ67_3003561 [Cordylochernes scorpioides]|uniref:Uncharacterized protein n=1 Tax=Cordylochernes scorpioides TaxID=51811 RepID=A0ABY6K959_9ARAC|nr:hypothetical protein LAZ67_3003561 [Cordylochernes scorpioides]